MRKVTIVDVAKEASLSTATVSYVLNNKKDMPKETKLKVYDAAKKLGYSPSYIARSLVTKKSNLIGIVIPQTEPGSELLFQNPFYSELLSGIEFYARKEKYHIIISGTDANEHYIELARQRNLDGIIVVGAYPDDFLNSLEECEIPIVVVDSYITNHAFHSININDRYGGYLATKYLMDKGHKSIGFVSGSIKEEGVNSFRYQGYLDALKEGQIEFDPSLVFKENVGFDGGYKIGEKISERSEITACFCTADIMAIGLLKCFLKNGKEVPKDISIIGFDNLNMSHLYPFELTTVSQNIFEKGQVAVELLLGEINKKYKGKREMTLPVSIVERESVKEITR